MADVPETSAGKRPSIDLARQFVAGEGQFKGHAQGVAPPAVEVARVSEPVDDFFADETVMLQAQARFGRSGRERMEARGELARRAGLAKAQKTNREKAAEKAAKFKQRVEKVRGMDSDAIDKLQAGAWYRSLPLAKREQVDEAIHDAMMSGFAYFGDEEDTAVEESSAGVAEEVDGDEALNAYLDDESGYVQDPTGRGDETLDDFDPVDAHGDAELAAHVLSEDHEL